MNLAKAIDRLLRIDPKLGDQLIPIRDKYVMRPRRSGTYWKELLKFMNSDTVRQNPRWSELRQVVIPPSKNRRARYTFDEVRPTDIVLGIIPENLSDRLRRYDLKTIKMAKIHTEAEMTGNQEAMIKLSRDNDLRTIELKRLWVALKDHFQLWHKDVGATYIRKKGPVLVLAQQQSEQPSTPVAAGQQVQPGSIMFQTPFGVVQTNPQVLKKILKLLGLPLPPGMEEDEESS